MRLVVMFSAFALYVIGDLNGSYLGLNHQHWGLAVAGIAGAISGIYAVIADRWRVKAERLDFIMKGE